MKNVTKTHLLAIDYMDAAASYRKRAAECSSLEGKRRAWLITQARDARSIARTYIRRNRFFGHVLDGI